MTTAAETERIAVRPRESVSTRIVAFMGRSPVHIALFVLAGLWLVPTVGSARDVLPAPSRHRVVWVVDGVQQRGLHTQEL